MIENHGDFSNSVLIGLQPRGSAVADRLHDRIKTFTGIDVPLGTLDITFFRDDFRRRNIPIAANATKIDFLVEDKRVILVDDVLYTGRSVRAGLDALMAYGRPKEVEFLALIDRRFSRQLPVSADYIGRTVDAIKSEHVEVIWEGSSGVVTLKTIDK